MLANAQDLSFKAVQKSAHKRLSAAEVQQYNTDGFCQPFDIFGPSEIAEIREYVDGLMADMGDAGSYGINCYQARLSGIYDIATDPRILDCVEDLLGPDILCWATAILSKKPHDPKRVPWH